MDTLQKIKKSDNLETLCEKDISECVNFFCKNQITNKAREQI